MTGSPAFPELATIVRQGASPRRRETLRRLADLFASGAALFRPEHVDLFDEVLTSLIADSDSAARADLAWRMAEFSNAPPTLIARLATEDDIKVAAPLLRRSRGLEDTTLISVARHKSQEHLFAIAERPAISAEVTDVVVKRGDRDVIRRVAGNDGANFSTRGFSGLLNHAREDGMLILKIGARHDLTPTQLQNLLTDAPVLVRRRLAASASPERRAAIEHFSATISGEIQPQAPRDFTGAKRRIMALHRAGRLDEATLWTFARERQHEEAIVALAVMTNISPETADSLVMGERQDSVLLLGRAIGLEWDVVRSLMLLRFATNRAAAPADIDIARSNFERISPAIAQRVLLFWQTTLR